MEADLVELLRGTGSQVRFSRHDRLLYSTDASLYQQEPLGVVVPASVDDAARVLGWCVKHRAPLLPRGGGTSLAGQCTNRAIVLDLSPHCRSIGPVQRVAGVASDPARPGAWQGHYVEVEPGCTVDELNEELARRGERLFFAPDPATSRQACIGGCLGNNAAGARSIRYGRTSENILAIEAALADPASPGRRAWLERGGAPGAARRDPAITALAQRVIDTVLSVAPLIRERFPRTIRRNAGYALDMILAQIDAGATAESLDLAPLLCGSEGTLALTTRARVRLMPTPAKKGLLVASFSTLEAAIDAVQPLLSLGLPLGLSAVELLDDVVLDAARGNIEYRRYVELLPGASAERNEPKAVLYVEFFAFEPAPGHAGIPPAQQLGEAFEKTSRLLGTLPGLLPGGVSTSTDAGAMLKAWALRKAGEPLLHGLPGARKPITFVEDNAVPVERLAEFVREFKKIVARHGTRAAYWAHASVGVLHVRPMIDLHDPADRERMVRIAVEVADLARACGGIMSGEHGDGKVRGPLIERFFGSELVAAFRAVKSAFDPLGLLNPGNIVGPYGPPESMATGLRVDAEAPATGGRDHDHPHEHLHGHAAPDFGVETFFNYDDHQGFAHAVEACNGAGVCRKRSGGTMCPSYMGTQDERHATRGRGNALRLAISGQTRLLGPGTPDFLDPDTHETLRLCLSCKACKSECPSNVDIARLKAEYTAQSYRARAEAHGGSGAPLQARVFGHVRSLNRLGSLTPGLANWVNSLGVTKRLVRCVLGVDERRSLPRFETSLWALLRRERRTSSSQDSTQRPVVILYADCFTAYNEPRIGLAAARVLEAFGYEVRLVPDHGTLFDGQWGGSGCCGRAMISTGLLKEACQTAGQTLGTLRDAISQAQDRFAGLVVCEPSCLSAIKDDWLELKLDVPLVERERLAARSFLVEEFLEKRWDSHPRRPRVAAEAGRVLLHAHCHQKALWGTDSSGAILKRLLGPDAVKVLDTGCCGMAGSFGFTADRYDLSMRIANLALLPQLAGAPHDATLCAPGTSCRHQVHDATSARRRALHPVELIDRLIERAPG
ncbi:MAG TPA: FAD-linked oxidase C-terminal domain-containing protein [Phycisphaerales bacterium]|nr:FAD-linked oxidase C-terminal domain-containing protein [Phycisphaerales bacterium]